MLGVLVTPERGDEEKVELRMPSPDRYNRAKPKKWGARSGGPSLGEPLLQV